MTARDADHTAESRVAETAVVATPASVGDGGDGTNDGDRADLDDGEGSDALHVCACRALRVAINCKKQLCTYTEITCARVHVCTCHMYFVKASGPLSLLSIAISIVNVNVIITDNTV